MKSEFILAFNEICESRGLPKEDVFEALKTALVSAFRRDANLSNTQAVVVEIDPRTGEPTIFAEKEVVDHVIDNRTEVQIDVAHRSGHPDAQMGDVVMMDSTTSSFGRIAAQTAKQVLLQRVREAEREHLYEDFSGREGELVNGTVQSISGQHITIGLGRTEAILPKSHQVPGERYRAHDKIRVFVLEVRRTNRGPQIFVSRNHRNLLRRLLELEVPEIYNGQVEIKSIAREAGQRSKVAVQALQPGVDPVGACVGMRGVRIQSIVRELNDEKIDVIEWDPDQHVFIAKALSPARVSQVFLEEHPDDGKTAIVIVPDDQLSLAIGREGQNARLAAKLTGWRIDIKSLTEAAGDALSNLDNPAVPNSVRANQALVEQAQLILDKKAAARPITSEDYHTLDRLVGVIEGAIVGARSRDYEKVRKQRALARKNVPQATWQLPLDELDLPGRIHNLLLDNNVETVGDVLYQLSLGDEVILGFKGFGDKLLDTLKEMTADYMAALEQKQVEEAAAPGAEAAELAAAGEVPDEAAEAPAAVTAETAEAPAETAVAIAETAAAAEAEAAAPAEADLAVVEGEPEPETAAAVVAPEPPLETAVAAEAEAAPAPAAVETPADAPVLPDIDDLSKSLVADVIEEEEEEEVAPVVIVRPATKSEPEEEDDDAASRRRDRKGRQLVYNEDIGEVVIKRKRKGSRRRPTWEDYDGEDDF